MDQRAVKILFADDAPEILKRASDLLSGLPVEIVGKAVDGEQALELAELHNPDIVILDLRMPKRDGIAVVAELRRRGSKAVLIVLTNLDSPSFRQRAIEAGADHFLSKQTDLARVREIVEAFIRKTT